MMLRRWILSAILLLAGFAYADWAADRDGSAGYVTVTTLATAVDEAVPFVVVYLSDLPADFHTAMSDASDTDGKTIRVSNSDGTTQLACVPIGINTSTDTGCLIFLGTGMSASVDVDYRIYVGNASLSMPTASGGMGEQAVFAAYAGVYFPGVDTRDWTAGGRTLTAVNSPGTAASGYEGITAATYNGSSQYHKHEGTQAVTDWPLTLEAVAYADNTTADHCVVALSDSATSFSIAENYLSGTSSSRARMLISGPSGSLSVAATAAAFSASTWYYLTGTRDNDSGSSRIQIDAGTAGTNTTTVTAAPTFNRLGIGARISSSVTHKMGGRVAVVLLSSSVRSADCISTMQDNWAGTLYSTGAWTALGSCNSGSTGWVLFQTAATTSASGSLVDWTSTSNALVDDSNYTQAALDPAGNYESEYLNLTNINYGTTVPTSADSYTVTVRIKRARATGGGDEINDLTVQFIDETGTRIGDNVAHTLTNWPTTAASVDYTITGHTFDGSEFDADSGLAIRATGIDSATDCDARVLVAWIKIDWDCGDDAAAKARGFFALTN